MLESTFSYVVTHLMPAEVADSMEKMKGPQSKKYFGTFKFVQYC